MKQVFNYYCLLIIGLMTASAFVLAQTLAQVLSAVIFFPLFIYFVDLVVATRTSSKKVSTRSLVTIANPTRAKLALIQFFSRERKTAHPVAKLTPVDDQQLAASLAIEGDSLPADQIVAEDGEVLEAGVDVNRRLLLKTIASAGIGLFLMTLFTNKANAAFFGSVPGPGTVALKDSNDNVIDPAIKTPTDGYKISEVDDATSPAYYGFVDKTGAWFIMKEESSGAYRYTKGTSSFSSNWTSRASLTYGYFDSIF